MQMRIKSLYPKSLKTRKLIFFILGLMVLLVSLTPENEFKDISLPDFSDKIVHITMFLVLGFWIIPSFPNSNILVLGILLIFYGLLIEFLQKWLPIGRSFDLLDWIADIIGVIIGIYGFKMFSKRMLMP